MAPAVVLLAAWRSRRIGPGVARWCAIAILLSYAVQLLGLVAGLIAARGFADPWAHLLDFTALVGVIVAGEYVGHGAAAALGVNLLASSPRKRGPNVGMPDIGSPLSRG